jgi:predicted aconitase with swiveling domain
MGSVIEMAGVVIVRGAAAGSAVCTDEPISFWGGLDPETGEIIDRRHPLSGENICGRVLVLPHGRGSCSASGVLLESIRNGRAPAAIIVSRLDPIIGLGSILGDELYDKPVPIVLLSAEDRGRIHTGDVIEIQQNGRVLVRTATRPLGANST